MNDDQGYRLKPASGPRVRTDVIDVYVFRRVDAGEVEFLQLLRAGPPLANSWHPVMAHIEAGEKAVGCLWREMREELGLDKADPSLLGAWALEQVHPFFIAELDAIVMSPRFAAEVGPHWSPTLNDEHSAHRWVKALQVTSMFMWPGQIAACREIVERLVPGDSLMRELVRVK